MHLAAGLSDAPGPSARPFPANPDDAGISAPASASALTVLWPHDDPSSHLLLPEPPEDDAPIVRVGTDALADLPDGAAAGRYLVLGEIARGGMGVVLRARDVDLGRDLALKVLQTRYRGDPDVVSRFVEEARIGGQLQHPGIVPVHELGTLGDRRPYFTMKLVKGRTLAALLQERVARCGSTDPVGWVKPALWSRPHESAKLSPDRELPILHGGGSRDRPKRQFPNLTLRRRDFGAEVSRNERIQSQGVCPKCQVARGRILPVWDDPVRGIVPNRGIPT